MRQSSFQTPDPDTRLILEKGGTHFANRLIAPLDTPTIDFQTWFGLANLRAEKPAIPDLAEPEVVRHYTVLSQKNFGVDTGPYPLGSCTMKYNPKVHETLAALPGFANVHPLQPDATAQGNLALMADLEKHLCAICGVDRFTFQPSAGAHGEWTGLLMIKAYHDSRGEGYRNVMLVPDSAHGTNPASAAMVGYEIRQIASGPDGMVDLNALEAALDERCAGLMLTNPNTLGLFEKNIGRIAALVHHAGGQLYYDGANINAILLQTRPGDMGFDVVHLNLHKSFSTPHGGGGPGSGPVGVKAHLAPFLPAPDLMKNPTGSYSLEYERPLSVGRVRSFNGSFLVLVRAYAYILANGAMGLREVSQASVANANYLLAHLRKAYDLPFDQPCLHEFVLSGSRQKELGCSTMDIAKRLIDYGFHPPTVYFPLIVKEAMMIEPTETETQEGLDGFVEAMLAIAEEVKNTPELLHNAPHPNGHTVPISRPDELRAAKDPVLRV
ncbi:MAG: aminomethyl-transferring glycine dehydrogenase subunit GcvPB [Eubacteriales bacterium]|nr:aminomethyl-transferring glycine dehydrogenase subunit GcvPB [Eubacteriales bacterium]